MSMFNAKIETKKITEWIKDWFEENGKGCRAVIGISGGKDSTIVAALCAKALGNDRVVGVIMPNGHQGDFAEAIDVCRTLKIQFVIANLKNVYSSVLEEISQRCVFVGDKGAYKKETLEASEQTKMNLPPRLRMATLYAVAQSVDGRVANTCNLSEDWIGYSTRYGDSVGDFSPLSKLTATEVKEVGYELGLPEELVEKTPSDGLCGKTDEDNFGFTYEVLDKYIRTGQIDDEKAKKKIDYLHEKNLFKLYPMETFFPSL